MTLLVLRAFVYEISAVEPGTFVMMTLVLLVTAAAASCVPARRAMAVDPAVALRHE